MLKFTLIMVVHVFTVAPVDFEGALVEVESDMKKGPAVDSGRRHGNQISQ